MITDVPRAGSTVSTCVKPTRVLIAIVLDSPRQRRQQVATDAAAAMLTLDRHRKFRNVWVREDAIATIRRHEQSIPGGDGRRADPDRRHRSCLAARRGRGVRVQLASPEGSEHAPPTFVIDGVAESVKALREPNRRVVVLPRNP